jgi:hypothetical protein
MTNSEEKTFKADLRIAVEEAINQIGVEAFKRISWFASSDPAFRASKLKKVA